MAVVSSLRMLTASAVPAGTRISGAGIESGEDPVAKRIETVSRTRVAFRPPQSDAGAKVQRQHAVNQPAGRPPVVVVLDWRKLGVKCASASAVSRGVKC